MESIKSEKNLESYFRDKMSTREESTIKGAKFSLKNFDAFCTETFHKKLDELVDEILGDEGDQYQLIVDVLQKWVSWNHKNNRSSGTIKRYFSAVNRYLGYRGFKFNTGEIYDTVLFPRKVVEEKAPLTIDEIRKILKVAKYKKISLYLALLSSGMRIGEAISIRKKDLETVHSENGKSRIKVNIPASISKNKIGRSTFISNEAHRHIISRLKTLDENGLVWGVSEKKSSALLTEQNALARYLNRIGLDDRYEATGRRKISLHSFRAYFFTKASRIDHNFAQIMTGHSGYLLREYDRLAINEKLELYLKVEPELTIDDSDKIKLEKDKLAKEKTEVYEQRSQNERLVKRIENLEYGKKGRNHVFYRNMLETQGNRSISVLLTLTYLLFEMGHSEDQKRKIWKEIQKKKNVQIFNLLEFPLGKVSLKNWHSTASNTS